MTEPHRIAVLVGSLRADSINRRLAVALAHLVPPGTVLQSLAIDDLPLFNQDHEQDPPEPVRRLRREIRDAGAIIFVTPEYNRSIPGVLKNAIDWASRPPEQPFDGKPVAIMGASAGALGTARAQYHLRQVFVFLNAHVLNKPEVMIGAAGGRFDAEGNLTDEATRGFVKAQLEALRDWTLRLRR